MNSKRTDSNKNHPILIYWNEADTCFIAEAPDCLTPSRLEPDRGETGIPEQVEPLQGKGASHGEALADVLHRIEVWAGQQRITPTEPGSPVPRASPSSTEPGSPVPRASPSSTEPGSPVPRASPSGVDRSWYGGRRAGIVACLTVFIVGCAVFAFNKWPPVLLSTLQPAQTAQSVSPTAAIVPPTAAIVPAKLVISALEVTSNGAARGEPRVLSVLLQWSVPQPRAGQTSKINMECTLTRAGKTLLDGVQRAQPGSYEICRAVLSTDQHKLTIELPDGIPAGDYELQTAIWLEGEAPELLVRQVRIPEATPSPKRIPVTRNTQTSEPAQRTKNL